MLKDGSLSNTKWLLALFGSDLQLHFLSLRTSPLMQAYETVKKKTIFSGKIPLSCRLSFKIISFSGNYYLQTEHNSSKRFSKWRNALDLGDTYLVLRRENTQDVIV